MSGFSSYVRPEVARSVVLYLEQEDPLRTHREKVVCAVNLGDFELHYPAQSPAPESPTDDGRSVRRRMWDEAVRALVLTVSENGLNPRYVRNDKNACRLVLKQDSVEALDRMPDEFFSMELYYCSSFELERRKLEYVKRLHKYEEDLYELRARIQSWKTSQVKKVELQSKLKYLERDKLFFVGSTPDPREMDSGLIFQIEIFTLKEFGVMKEKLKQILSRYIDELSYVAAAHGTSLNEHLKKTG